MILHLYFARRFVVSFLALTGVLLCFILLVDLVDTARRFGDRDIGFGDIAALTLLNAPASINQILPLIMILATIVLFISLARSSELVATRAAGRSALKILVAPVAVALIIGGLAVTMLSPIAAGATKRYATLEETYKTGRASSFSISSEGLWLRQGDEAGQTVIRAWRSNEDASVLYEVTFLSFAPSGEPIKRVSAQNASLKDGAWVLRGAKSWPLKQGQNAEAAATVHDELVIPSSLTLERIRENFGNPDTISIWDLPEFITQLDQAGFSSLKHRLWFQAELARPVFLTAMVLVASAFTMRHTRFGGTGIAVLGSVLLGFSLYFVRSFAHILGENGQIPITLAVWAPPVAAIMLALGILLHMEDG